MYHHSEALGELHHQKQHPPGAGPDHHSHDDHWLHEHKPNSHADAGAHHHHPARGLPGWLQEAIPFLHSHHHGEVSIDRALEANDRGIWALKVSFIGLGVTALFQLVIVLLSGSVGLLAETIHNFSDAITAVPLWIAFALARRAATRRYTYGYGRAEDIAGVIIVGMIFLSALVAGYESILKFAHPEPLRAVEWVMAAALVGFLGNEGIALLRIRIGRDIGSAALVADGQHARIDGLTSLAVFLGAVGSLLGFPLADPIIGLCITLTILLIVKETAVTIWHRLMDAIDPELVEALEQAAKDVPGVMQAQEMRLRWLGHLLQAEVLVTVDEDLSTRESHHIAEQVRHALFEAQSHLASVLVHVDPCGHNGEDPHRDLAHHAGRH